MVLHIYNPSTWEEDTGGPGVQSQNQMYGSSKLENQKFTGISTPKLKFLDGTTISTSVGMVSGGQQELIHVNHLTIPGYHSLPQQIICILTQHEKQVKQ